MDRRKMHKANGLKVGKNKEIMTRDRAHQRDAQRDAQRNITPTPVEVVPSRMDRLKKWREEREEKKKKEAEVKKKPFVTVVKRGVFLDKTNYTELNKLRRKNTTTKKVKPTASNPNLVEEQNLASTTEADIYRETSTEIGVAEGNNEFEVNASSAAGQSSVLNTTFELPDSVESIVNSVDQVAAVNIKIEVEASQSNEPVITPSKSSLNTSLNSSLNYVSPFVTISRGKHSAQKEKKVRESLYKLEAAHPNEISPIARQNREAASYFRFQVDNETEKLMQIVEHWDKYKNDNGQVDSVYLDQIDVAIGQTKLLIAKKFKQFMGLIDQCENGSGEKPVLPKDLEGFWSMVFMQVENCNERFRKLNTLKENDWIEVDLLIPVKVEKQPKRKVTKKGVTASSGIHKLIEEARMKMKASKISATASSSRHNDSVKNYSMSLRQTPARLSMTNAVAKTPKSIIKVKTTGVQRNTKSVAFESPTAERSQKSPKFAPNPKHSETPKPRINKRRASTSGIPTEKPFLQEGNSSFLTPNSQQITNDTSTSSLRRSHRRLFSVVEQ